MKIDRGVFVNLPATNTRAIRTASPGLFYGKRLNNPQTVPRPQGI
jgi:hypothetical protein